MSLHRILSLFVCAIAVLALGAAVSLAVLTSYLHRTTVELETGLQSVRLAEEMQIDLLTYIRARDAFLRTRVQSDLIRKLHESRQYSSTSEEDALLTEAERLITSHFGENGQLPEQERTNTDLEQAFAALRQFIDINVEQAQTSMRE